MKKILLILIVFLAPVVSHGEERISSFRSLIEVNEDSTVDVTEAITYDFGADSRHGIYRDIPVKYRTSLGSYSADIKVQSVADDNGEPLTYNLSRSGGDIRIKIGDSDKYVTGEITYVISYKVHDILSYFEDFDEIYWNVTGNGWNVPIDRVAGAVEVPATIGDSSCYRGYFGSSNTCSSSEASQNRLSFSSDGLRPGEGVTIAVGFPKGVVYEPTSLDRFLKFLLDNWILFVPVVVFFLLLYLWYTRGRDPKGRGTIVHQFDPPEGLTPAQVGTIYDETLQPKDVTAEMVYLAVKGHTKIHQFEKKKLLFSSTEYFLEKLNTEAGIEKGFDRTLYEKLFSPSNVSNEDIDGSHLEGVLLSSLSKSFHKDYKEIQKSIYESVVSGGWFVKDPQKVRTFYATVGTVLLFASGFVGGISESILVTGSTIVTGILFIVFSFLMPVKTKLGVLAYEHIKGFRDYVKTAEKDRLAFHNDPKNIPERFDTLLPFAMALGVEKQWAEVFVDIYKGQPGWYVNANGGTFNTKAFAADLSGFSSATSSAVAPRSSGSGSGGGGFSGGGGGGGGGGSW